MTISAFRLAGRIFLALLLLAGIAAAWLHRESLSPAAIEAALRGSSAAPLLFLLVHLLASLLFIPRTLIAIAAGLIFGFAWGLVWANIGSVAGALAGLWVVRYLNSGAITLEALPRLGPYIARAEQGGWRSVALLRLLPIMNHSLVNYALGLTKVPLGAYTLGSFLGQLPATIAYVEFGAAGGQVLTGQAGWLIPTLVGLAALGVSVLLPRLVQWRS